MDSSTGQLGVLAAGGVLIGVPVVRELRSGGSLPSAARLTKPLIVVGGCALIANISPWLGVGLAWLAALGLGLSSAWAGAAPAKPRPLTGPGSTAPHVPGGPLPRTPHH